MKKATSKIHGPDLPDEIDFGSPEARRTGVRGKYAKRFADRSKLAVVVYDDAGNATELVFDEEEARILRDIIKMRKEYFGDDLNWSQAIKMLVREEGRAWMTRACMTEADRSKKEIKRA